VQASDAGIYAQFAGVSYNAVFIVEQQNKAQMDNCLAINNYGYCPDFSYGRFR
jgi:hypothetical protein